MTQTNTIYESVKQLSTPCYIIDQKRLDNNAENLTKDFKSVWGSKVITGYSLKTNSLPWIITHLKQKGYYAEVVSEQEYRLAKYLGFKGSEIILNGPVKSEQLLIEALNNGSITNIDNFSEIEIIEKNITSAKKEWNIGLRYNFQLEKECPTETIVGPRYSRFGFCIENGDFEKALLHINRLENVNIIGLHGHNSTKTKSLKIFHAIANEAASLISKYHLNLSYIDIGGGFFGDKPGSPSYYEYAKAISSYFPNRDKITLILEPGASIISSPISYLCEVVNTKHVIERCFVTLNGSLIHIDPQMHGIDFQKEIYYYNKTAAPITNFSQELCGFTCIELDRMGTIDSPYFLHTGDIIEFKNCGSYSMTLAPLFIDFFPKVYVYNGFNYIPVRDKWSEIEFTNKCEVDK